MAIERSAFRGRMVLFLAAFIGLAVFVAGLVLTILAARQIPASTLLPTSLSLLFTPIIIAGWGLLVLLLSGMLYPLVSTGFRRAIDANWQYEQLRGSLENQRLVLEAIRENVSVSDAAKQIAFRHKDRDALRHAINDDMDKHDYDAAIYLVNEMDRTFGYHEEAGALRKQIEAVRKGYVDNQVREGIDMLEISISNREWNAAVRQSDALNRRFPGRADVQKLPERITAARDAHKRELLKQWTEAVAKDDVDRSIDLLKQLDQYLTPGEAQAYIEVARDVFKKRLHQLAAQFSLHVQDKNWPDAVRIGKQIADEFPNTRIAAEVRERMPIMQDMINRANPAAAAAAAARPVGV